MKNKKDVLILCQYFYPEFISTATLSYDVAKAISEAGYSVGALCGYSDEYKTVEKVPKQEIVNGVEIYRVNYIKVNRASKIGRLINFFSFTISAFLKINKLSKYRILIVYSNPPVLPLIAIIAKMLFKVKVVFVSYDVYPEIAVKTKYIKENSIIAKVMNQVNNVVFSRLDSIVALSNEMKVFLNENRKINKSARINIIPNWYENKKNPLSLEKAKDNMLFRDFINNKSLIISYFGNLGIAQDIETIVEAIKQLSFDNSVGFIFAGHGNKMDDLKIEVENQKLNNVKIYDFLHGSDFEDALNISDAFIVSLERSIAGLAVPSKTYSYLMAGRPVISIMDKNTDISKELIAYSAGFNVENNKSGDLVDVINILKNDTKLRLDYGSNAKRLFEEKYTTEVCTDKYVRLVKNLLEDKDV